MSGTPLLRRATDADLVAVRALLSDAGLPLDGLDDCAAVLVHADKDGAAVGAVGFESHGRVGLLRSLVVRPDARGTGLGKALLRGGLDAMRAMGLEEAYGLTTTIPDLLRAQGWEPVPRASLPSALGASRELQGACPASAEAFRLRLAPGPR